ncbi:MAG: hypothetical protein DI537_20420 [Stutzerimonas stutzeri]|nr:MAG: hypothetical protein DI537_20420 [Stutzerimonas stutzeri]
MGDLTKAQFLALDRMATGDEVWTTPGPSASTFWYGKLSDRAPSHATLHALWRKGFIKDHETERGRGHRYGITDAGRAALSALENGPASLADAHSKSDPHPEPVKEG